MLKKQIYLDYNATTPLKPHARQALIKALDMFGNPSSVHAQGRAAKAMLHKARHDVAALVGADSDQVIFTSGATEAATTLLTPHYFIGRSKLIMSHLYIGATEHPCILAGGRFTPENTSIIPVFPNGLIDLDRLDSLLRHHDVTNGLPLVAIQYANHETGIIQPIGEIATIVKKFGGLLIVDAVQAMGKEKVTFATTMADFLIISAHKMGGPKGIGAFIACGPLIMPQPLLVGGGQEHGHRSGTQAMPLIAAFGDAAAHIAFQPQYTQHLLKLRHKLENGLKQMIAGLVIHGEAEKRLHNTCFFSVPNMRAETLAIALDLEGIAVSNGSACSSGKVGTSSVLQAMGVTGTNGAIRVSMGEASSAEDIDYFLDRLSQILKRKMI